MKVRPVLDEGADVRPLHIQGLARLGLDGTCGQRTLDCKNGGQRRSDQG
jgi:hypothetical protein